MDATESPRGCCTVHGQEHVHALEVEDDSQLFHGIRSVAAMASAMTRARADGGLTDCR
jgi:hypothetical protein